MRTFKRFVTGLGLVVIAATFALSAAALNQVPLGKHSQDEIKNACNAVGGTLLGVSDSGAYGCENDKAGTLVLCSKDQQCTGWVPARTRGTRDRILDSFKLPTMKATVK